MYNIAFSAPTLETLGGLVPQMPVLGMVEEAVTLSPDDSTPTTTEPGNFFEVHRDCFTCS